MKKFLKFTGLAVGGLLLVVVVALLFINSKGIPRYEVHANAEIVEPHPQLIERGKKLSLMLCAHCHLDQNTGRFSGKFMSDAPPEFGRIYSANITGDSIHGIGAYSDGELIYLLRTGVARDGRYLPPYMPKFPSMAHEDVRALVAFLRSGDEFVAPVSQPDSASEPSLLTKVLCNTMFKPFPMPEKIIEMPDTLNKVALGRYLAVNLECFSCHSADFKTNNFLEPEKSPGYFGGGNKPLNPAGEIVLTPNLTPHETGIGNWTEEQFIKAVKYGQRPGKPALQMPMQPYPLLTDNEAGAIFAYLKTIPPIDNQVKK